MDRFATKASGPDGLEAWCVAFAACVINFVMAGLGRMSGILYVAFIDTFHIDRRDASLPFSVRSSIRNLLGPAVGILGQKYGARPVIIVGGIIGVTSSAACFYVNDILWMAIMWGGISGTGAALTTTLNQAVIGQHFKKYRTTAAGMAFSGGCVGSFLFPVLIEYLLHTYQLGGTFLIIAGILMNVIPAALIMKKPSWYKNKNKESQVSERSNDIKRVSKPKEIIQNNEKEMKSYRNYAYEHEVSNENELHSFPTISTSKQNQVIHSQGNTSEGTFKDSINVDLLWRNKKLVMSLLTNDFSLKIPFSRIHPTEPPPSDTFLTEIKDLFCKIAADVHNGVVISVRSFTDRNAVAAVDRTSDKFMRLEGAQNLYLVDVTSAMSSNPTSCLSFCLEILFEQNKREILQSFPHTEHENVSGILEELWNLHVILQNNKKNLQSCPDVQSFPRSIQTKNDERDHSNTFYSHIKTACKLYTKPLFLMICLCRLVHFMTFMPILTTIVDFSMDKGLPREDGKYVIAALSLGDLMGRLCLGWITDRGYVTLPRYMLIVMIIQGASTATLSLMNSRAALMSAIVVSGLLQGSVFVRHPVLVSRYLESHEQSIAMGCLNFFSGLLGFILPSYIGYFRDTIGSYNGLLYINGAVGASVGLLWIFEPYFLKHSRSRTES